MRDSTTISLPEGMLAQLKEYVAKRGFASLSEYFLFAVEKEQELMNEDDILEYAKQAQKDYEEWNYIEGIDNLKRHVAELRKQQWNDNN